MNITENKTQIIEYKTQGTCCGFMRIAILNGILQDVEFIGGCDGNLKGIKNLLIGMVIDDVINKFRGITCGDKPTSCPDQLANCLIQYKSQKEKTKN